VAGADAADANGAHEAAQGTPSTGNEEVSSTRDTRFVSWTDLARVADEAADIDAIVRRELKRVGHPLPVDEPTSSGERRARHAPRRPRRGARLVALPLLVLVAAGGLSALLARDPPTAANVGPKPSTTVRVVAPAAPQPTPEPTRASIVEMIQARLTISERSWVEAVADGETVFYGFLTGEARTFHADRSLLIKLGNAGGARLVVNGEEIQEVTTGVTGEVVDVSFVLRDNRLVQLPT
jgi:cytoskeleton protein RodZ